MYDCVLNPFTVFINTAHLFRIFEEEIHDMIENCLASYYAQDEYQAVCLDVKD